MRTDFLVRKVHRAEIGTLRYPLPNLWLDPADVDGFLYVERRVSIRRDPLRQKQPFIRNRRCLRSTEDRRQWRDVP